MAATSIEWCDHSINPIRARHLPTGKVGHYCEKCASGCAHCYSSRMQIRFGTPEFGGGQKRGEFEIFLDESKLDEVRRRKKPTRYFWCDMTDLFGDWVPAEMIARCFAAMDATPQHTHMLLTKRPENIRRMMPPYSFDACLSGDCPHERQSDCDADTSKGYRENVWLGTSIATQADADKNIPELLKCRDLSPVLFLSAEPLLERINLHRWLWIDDYMGDPDVPGGMMPISTERDGIRWLIAGGESGPHARPCAIEWIRSLRDQCQAAGVPFFGKQLGAEPFMVNRDDRNSWPDGTEFREEYHRRYGTSWCVDLKDKKGGDWNEWPEVLRVRQFPSVTG